ncbi:MAG: hypothetical protein Ta2G_17880 [Termitinemataceae bacterium]|nr:MAG: hypothetical protein Ta2G_17880 [Termitinemataceae bacterium]
MKKKLIALTKEMYADLSSYCRDRGIESESELIRAAIAKYIYADFQDETLKLQGLNTMSAKLDEMRDMIEIATRYLKKMHINMLSYHGEIPEDLKVAAMSSALMRHEKFFSSFRSDLRSDPSFFEHLLHNYFSEDEK